MQYHQFAITVPESYQNALSERLFSLGALGLSEQTGVLTAYFPGTVDPKIISLELEHITSLLLSLSPPVPMTFQYSKLPDQDWNESWKKSFRPVSVGTRFTILPPWEQLNSDRIRLIIDPGMAFGTGHHETTRSCLILMERHASSVRTGSFLDIGTGTGLLAIAARALGFTKVIGVDTDPLAIDAARKNIELNQWHDGIELVVGDVDAAGGNYDMIAANLVSGSLIALAEKMAERLLPSGIVIMSGILKGQEKEVIEAAAKAGLDMIERLQDGKWVTLACRLRTRDAESLRTF